LIAFFAIQYFSSTKATTFGLVAINQAIAPIGHPAALPVVIAPSCRTILPVFIEDIACTSSNAFNARTLLPIQGNNCSSLSSFISFHFPTIFATYDIAESLSVQSALSIPDFIFLKNDTSGQ
jgi:hypothetical protein